MCIYNSLSLISDLLMCIYNSLHARLIEGTPSVVVNAHAQTTSSHIFSRSRSTSIIVSHRAQLHRGTEASAQRPRRLRRTASRRPGVPDFLSETLPYVPGVGSLSKSIYTYIFPFDRVSSLSHIPCYVFWVLRITAQEPFFLGVTLHSGTVRMVVSL